MMTLAKCITCGNLPRTEYREAEYGVPATAQVQCVQCRWITKTQSGDDAREQAVAIWNDKYGKVGTTLLDCDELKAKNAALVEVLAKVINQGSAHEQEDCPEDDTCSCEIAKAVNECLAGYSGPSS